MYLLQHIPVRPEDHHLQVIAIGGRYFQEKTLTFGCSSSPSLYDAPAEVVLALACISSRTPRHYCLRQLDDAMIIADLPQVKAWYRAYEDVCAYIEVRLAGVENPAKACAPASCGQLLGINVNLDNWTWNLDQVDENTQNAPQNFGPICLPNQKFRIFQKKFLSGCPLSMVKYKGSVLLKRRKSGPVYHHL